MQEERGVVQKLQEFMQAFSEFLGRPKTVFDIRDRAKLLLLLAAIIISLEGLIYYLQS